MAKPWLWRSKKPMSLSMLFPWDITEIIETISLIGCTDNECNPWSPWKQAARKQGEEHSWNWLSSGSTHGAKQASTAGETFWHNRDPWIPRTFFLSPYKFPKLPSSAWQLLPTTKPSFPTVAGPRECREGTAGRTRPSSGIRHIPTKRFGGGNQPVSVVLDMRQPCITTHLVSASHGPCQPLLYLRNC